MPKLNLKQFAQSGAVEGQVPTFNSATGVWEASTPTPVSGGLRLIASGEVSGADVQDLSVIGLDGDAHGFYMIRIETVKGASNPVLSLYLNGSAVSDVTYKFVNVNASQTVSGFEGTGFGIGSGTDSDFFNAIQVFAKTGRRRAFWWSRMQYDDPGTVDTVQLAHGIHIWDDLSTNITEIGVHASTSDGLAAGTRIEVWGGTTTDLTPSSETLTGDEFDGKPVYRQSFSGTTPTNASGGAYLTSSNDIKHIVSVYGYIEASDGNRFGPTTWHINDTTRIVLATLNGSGTDDIRMETYGSAFDSQPYSISVDYIKV